MGGGTVLHEAIRLGANVVGIDIDPIPVLQTKATLRLSTATHKEKVYHRFFNELRSRMDGLYATTCPACGGQAELQFLLYGLRKQCSCRDVLMLDDLTVRQDSPNDVTLCPACGTVRTGGRHECRTAGTPFLVPKSVKTCGICGKEFREALSVPFVGRYEPVVVVGHCPVHGQFYTPPTEHDCACMANARMQARDLDFTSGGTFVVPEGPKSSDLLARRIESFLDLFSPRQLLYIWHCRDLLSEAPRGDRLWLAMLVSTSLEFNSLLCGYKGGARGRPGAIRHVFSHHAYSFPYTALENNPVFSGRTSGTLNRLFEDRIFKAAKWAMRPVERRMTSNNPTKVSIVGEIDGGVEVSSWEQLNEGSRRFLLRQANSAVAAIPEGIADHVVTDPPYYDSVQYSDLSNFFRVWLRFLLPGEADWDYDDSGSAVSNAHCSGRQTYLETLTGIWRTCRHALKPGGRIVFTYHHWRAEAWADLTMSLLRVGLELVNRYVVASENPISVHIRQLKALKHDTVLVLRTARPQIPATEWSPPGSVNKEDSYAFCRDCGSVLGWLLRSAWDEQRVRGEWRRLLAED